MISSFNVISFDLKYQKLCTCFVSLFRRRKKFLIEDNMSMDIMHGTVKWFAKDKGYGILRAYKHDETMEEIFVHQSNILQSTEKNDGHQKHLDHGDAVEFWTHYNGRKDRIEARDVSRIPRRQLRSKEQLLARRKREEEERSRRYRKEEEERKEREKKHQAELDTMTAEKVSNMQYKKYIKFSESEKYYSWYQRVDGDYFPMLLYQSGFYLTCDLCGKKEHIREGLTRTPVIKTKCMEKPIFWGFASYNSTVNFLTDGEKEVEVDVHRIRRSYGQRGCIHNFAEFKN